jgi:endonuclease-8
LPEGDNIHSAAARLRAALKGHEVVRFELRRDPRGVRSPAPGTRVVDVDARGKHLLMSFDDGRTLHTHMQMQGAWHLYRVDERWRRPPHRARVIVEIDDGTTAVCFDAPLVELRDGGLRLPPSRAERTLARLGPDLAYPAVDLNSVASRLEAVDPTTAVATVLLDQRVAAGIGNVYKSELCWALRVHPATQLGAIDTDTRRELYALAHRLLVSNTGRARRVTFNGGLAVYGRARRPCPRCRTPIARVALGEPPRVTYWCPSCQPPPST